MGIEGGEETQTKSIIIKHIIIKTLGTEIKERILKAAKQKRQVTYKGKLIRITDFLTQILNIRRS
jgi:hypothetical protein